MSYTALALIISALFLFPCFLVASIFNYKARFKMNYHLRQHFPYELNYHGRYKDNIYGNLLYALYAIVVILFLIFFDTKHDNGFMIASLIMGALAFVTLTALIYVPVDQLRAHMIIDAAAFILSLALSASIVMGSYYKYKDYNSASSLVSFIISMIIMALYVILILNPKLSHWAEMDDETKEDGTVVKVRPKWFVLAYSEWALLILYPFSLITLFIETI